MLATRLLTVFVAAAFLIPFSLYANAWGFSVLAAMICGLVLWEWLALTSIGPAMRWLLLSVWVGLVVGALLDPWLIRTPWALGLVGWVGLVWLLYVPYALWRVRTPNGPTAAITSAWLMLGTWAAVWLSREQSLAFMVSIFALVWLADTAAYFGGRALGRRKLAPRISPGKTWAGAISGAVAVLLIALAWGWADTRLSWDGLSVYSLLWQRWGWGAAACLALLVALSITGDLVESLVKRVAGVKDSSGLLPGHGGVLDRVDALLPVLPMAVVLVS